MGRLCPPTGENGPENGPDPAFFAGIAAFFGVFHADRPLARFLICKVSMNNILVIDDTEDIRNLIATVLSNYGFTVREAANGKQGVKMIAEEKPDLVICDVNMPAMGGYETLAAVRESSQTATIPFILMTGLGQPRWFSPRHGLRRRRLSGQTFHARRID